MVWMMMVQADDDSIQTETLQTQDATVKLPRGVIHVEIYMNHPSVDLGIIHQPYYHVKSIKDLSRRLDSRVRSRDIWCTLDPEV